MKTNLINFISLFFVTTLSTTTFSQNSDATLGSAYVKMKAEYLTPIQPVYIKNKKTKKPTKVAKKS
jgi:hypothetical protein